MSTTNRGFAKVATSSPDYEANGPWAALNTTLDTLDVAMGIEVDSADGAIAIKEGTVIITKGSAAALTLAAPTAGLPAAGTPGDDGKVLRIISTTAFAHTVTTPANNIKDGSTTTKDTATWAARVGGSIVLAAYGGAWYVVGTPLNVTLTEV
jgi:hypothetical protein